MITILLLFWLQIGSGITNLTRIWIPDHEIKRSEIVDYTQVNVLLNEPTRSRGLDYFLPTRVDMHHQSLNASCISVSQLTLPHKQQLILCVQSNYTTKVFIQRGNLIITMPFELNQAVRNSIYIEEKDAIFLGGDWGSGYLLEFNGGEFQNAELKRIEMPTTRHVMSLARIGDYIYIGSRSDGLFRTHYESFEWSALRSASQIELATDVVAIGEFAGDEAGIILSTGEILKVNELELLPSDLRFPFGSLQFRNAIFLNGFLYIPGTTDIWMTDGVEVMSSRLPESKAISSMALLADGTVRAIDRDGTVWRLAPESEFMMVELANTLDMAFMPSAVNVRYSRARLGRSSEITHIFWDSTTEEQIRLYQADLTGRFLDVTSALGPVEFGRIDHLAIADITGNGFDDLVVSSQTGMEIKINIYSELVKRLRLQRSFSIPQHSFDRLGMIKGYSGDGSSGRHDLIMSFYFQNGTNPGELIRFRNNRFSDIQANRYSQIPYSNGWNTVFDIADFTGNGVDDIILANFWRNDRIIFGMGESEDLLYGPFLEFGEESNTSHIIAKDMNADNKPDIIRVTQQGGLELWINIYPEHPVFVKYEDPQLASFTAGDVRFIEVADLNSDGSNDLIISLYPETGKGNYLLLNTPSGFVNRTDALVHVNQNPALWSAWDYNRDGILDILSVNPSHTTVYLNISMAPNHKMTPTEGLQATAEIRSAINGFYAYAKFTLSQAWFYWYALVIILTYLVMYINLLKGYRTFRWPASVILAVFMVNNLAFWLVLLLTSSQHLTIALTVPFAVAFTGSVLPNMISWNLRYFGTEREKQEHSLALLRLLLRFSHGGWANSLLNRLIMLLKNSDYAGDHAVLSQIRDRFTLLQTELLPDVEQMYELTRLSGIGSELAGHLTEDVEYLKKTISVESMESRIETIQKIEHLRMGISKLKKRCFQYFTTSARFVTLQALNEYQDLLIERGIDVSIEYNQNDEYHVLCQASTLYMVLDNLLSNAIKATADTADASISINLSRKDPKIILMLYDNGRGMDTQTLKSVFEDGFSEFGTSGLGLPVGRKELQKFNARIAVESDGIGKGTRVQLEFLQGFK